jgi:HTH-type transcriptional regulator/antitoxin HigA
MVMKRKSRKKNSLAAVEASWNQAWPKIEGLLRPIKTNAALLRRSTALDELLEKTGDNEDHPLSALCDMLAQSIEHYEEQHVKIEESSPTEILRFVIDQHGLKQADLSDILPQSNLSAVLNGKRSLTSEQIVLLSERFSISPSLLLPKVHLPKPHVSKRRSAKRHEWLVNDGR